MLKTGQQFGDYAPTINCVTSFASTFRVFHMTTTELQLGEITLGFGYAHEWPKSWVGGMDIDSGPTFPVFDISAGSSGMAFVGASAFGDEKFLKSLSATLDFAAFPSRKAGRLRYCASNQVGDAAFLYAATLGPLWEKIGKGGKL